MNNEIIIIKCLTFIIIGAVISIALQIVKSHSKNQLMIVANFPMFATDSV